MKSEKEKYKQLTLDDMFTDNKYLLSFKVTIKDGAICVCVERQDRAEQARDFTPPKEA